ncbi:MAG: hemolysin [Bacteroidetes bacterium HGW-Bacteroidetes-22]|jgi:CBS domain containing-hemolysin-like protein|nr:MAG: hemolysin [Bacteroidetes bacterium HGW-Bacteroidetes-22]PKP35618.1 MAG: hemolysin [Bacteroidetes bacterium HGW-Bacteroidetes-17]
MDNWTIIIITLIFSGFFSGIEIAYVSSNRLKIELDKSKGLYNARIIASFATKPSKFIGTLLLGNNIALVLYGIAMANILTPWFSKIYMKPFNTEFFILISQTIIATLIILVTAEFLPKILFRIRPNAILKFFALPIKVIYFILYPFVFLFIGFSEFVLRKLFRVIFNTEDYSFSPIDLGDYVKEFTQGENDDSEISQEIQIFQNAIDFQNIKLRECMSPRTEIIALDESDTVELLRSRFIQTGHSKILIYRENIDNIIGYTHSYDMFKKPTTIREILRSIIIVPETMLANKVLSMMLIENKSVAVVVDEFGGTSGMITMEDVIEEIFGEIEDEHDTEDLIEKQIQSDEFLFSGRLEIDYLNEKYNLAIPTSDEYETLAGYILHHYENIPLMNESMKINNFHFKIVQAEKNRIELVNLKISNPDV